MPNRYVHGIDVDLSECHLPVPTRWVHICTLDSKQYADDVRARTLRAQNTSHDMLEYARLQEELSQVRVGENQSLWRLFWILLVTPAGAVDEARALLANPYLQTCLQLAGLHENKALASLFWVGWNAVSG
jgi:hypothetical protein